MRRKEVVVAICTLLAAGGVALAADEPFAMAVASPAVECADRESAPLFVATASACTATATCGSSPSVSCSGNTSCTAIDQNCAGGIQGFVRCDNVTTNCPACPSECDEGDIRFIPEGCCCSPSGLRRQRYVEEVCVEGRWERSFGVLCAGGCSGGPCL